MKVYTSVYVYMYIYKYISLMTGRVVAVQSLAGTGHKRTHTYVSAHFCLCL
jgi:hypothetical protein